MIIPSPLIATASLIHQVYQLIIIIITTLVTSCTTAQHSISTTQHGSSA
jgi:hypothetical protein